MVSEISSYFHFHFFFCCSWFFSLECFIIQCRLQNDRICTLWRILHIYYHCIYGWYNLLLSTALPHSSLLFIFSFYATISFYSNRKNELAHFKKRKKKWKVCIRVWYLLLVNNIRVSSLVTPCLYNNDSSHLVM